MRMRWVSVARLLPGAILIGCASAASPHATSGADPASHTAGEEHAYPAPDVRFVRGMIAHHAQAVLMTDMVPERTGRADIRLLARRIDVSQQDEMRWMRGWLTAREHVVPDTTAAHAGHDRMPGMLGDEELHRLERARGAAFDRLFLEYMIRHHEGALTMVAELRAAGGARDPDLFQFASHVDADQRSEIERMRRLQSAIIQGGTK